MDSQAVWGKSNSPPSEKYCALYLDGAVTAVSHTAWSSGPACAALFLTLIETAGRMLNGAFARFQSLPPSRCGGSSSWAALSLAACAEGGIWCSVGWVGALKERSVCLTAGFHFQHQEILIEEDLGG